jgi:hypothetical protein
MNTADIPSKKAQTGWAWSLGVQISSNRAAPNVSKPIDSRRFNLLPDTDTSANFHGEAIASGRG